MGKFVLPLLLFSVFGIAQKNYIFDYILRYEYRVDEKSAAEDRYVLTNSGDGSYAMFVAPDKDGNWHMFISDVNGLVGIAEMKKEDFPGTQTITLEPGQVMARDPEYDKTGEYDLTKIGDTVVGKETLRRFMLKSNDLDKEIRKKLATVYYILQNGSDFHAPINTFSSFFDVWILNDNTPRGIPQIMYLDSYNKKERNFIYQLKEIGRVSKTVVLPKGIEIVKSGNTVKIIRK